MKNVHLRVKSSLGCGSHGYAKSGHNSQYTAAPQQRASWYPEGPLLFTSPRASKPNSLDDSWTFRVHHVSKPIGQRLPLPNVPLYLKLSYIFAKRWLIMDNINKVIEPQYSYSAAVGRDMAINRKVISWCFLQMLHLRLTVPPRPSEKTGGQLNKASAGAGGSPRRPTHAVLNLETAKVCGSDCPWLRTLKPIPLLASRCCSAFLKMAAWSRNH